MALVTVAYSQRIIESGLELPWPLRPEELQREWPLRPVVPNEWLADGRWTRYVIMTISEGFCPKHRVPLYSGDREGWCTECESWWSLSPNGDLMGFQVSYRG